ncbi:MAG: hypothetical protein Q8P20_10205 [bacterium]|nr:hypothetical protein [bacterium]
MMTNIDLTKLFLGATKGSIEFQEALDIVRSNSRGNYWLVGGFVYRSIASALYGLDKPSVDLDFIVESTAEEISLPKSWKKKSNRYGNPKFIREDGLTIDFVPLKNVSSIRRRGLLATIENFLTGTPLNVQSIIYDVMHNQIKGNIGIKALLDKSVAVNDLEQAEIYSKLKGKPVNEIICEKALALGFTPVFYKTNKVGGKSN